MEFTIEEYIEAKRLGLPWAGKKGSPKTLASYESALRRAERLVGKPMAQFHERDIVKMLRDADTKGVSQATKNQTIAALKGAFEWAIGNDLHSGKNPLGAVRTQTPSQRLPRVLSVAEIERLFEAIRANDRERREGIVDERAKRLPWAREDWAEKYVLILKLMAYGGLRIGEALSLKKRDIDEGGIRIVGKGDKERWVPLMPNVLDELRGFVEKHPYTDFVFYAESGRTWGIDTGKPMVEDTVYRVFADGLKRAGLPLELTPHALRHSFATNVGRATGRLEVVQDLLGHADPKTTRRYMQLSRQDLIDQYGVAFGA